MASCGCVAHVVGRAWASVQVGESYIVHATPVKSNWGAGSYLAKYMEKEFGEERASALGMARRWSTSRSWPREPRARLEQSLRLEGWKRTSWRVGHVEELEGLHPDDRLPGVTFDLGKRIETESQKKRKNKASARRLVRMIGEGNGNANESPQNVSKERDRG